VLSVMVPVLVSVAALLQAPAQQWVLVRRLALVLILTRSERSQ
jgi:hypothetical protein